MKGAEKKFKFSIDRGGTFTDIFCQVECNGVIVSEQVSKLLSVDPKYKDAPTEGIRRILEKETGISHPSSELIDTSRIIQIRMGTTVATNALLERKGEKCALVTTKGFRDLQRIGNQSRPNIFDLEIQRPDLLFEYVCEIDERVAFSDEDDAQHFDLHGEKLKILKEPDPIEVNTKLKEILAHGIKSIAVNFLHSHLFNKHEELVREAAEELGFEQISLSSQILPMIRMVPRGCTTCVDAYLTPIIKQYLVSFTAGFDEGISQVNVSFMQSDGGLTPMQKFLGNRAILSGPAGGFVGYALSSYSGPSSMPIIGFDMGGTSTDVSRYAGTMEHVYESNIAGVTIQSPQLDINTVAAGGGSRLFFRNGLFIVGPESAGAHPGPVCYRKGGFLTVTDANLLLGYLQPHMFPAIFGPEENLHLDLEATKAAFKNLTCDINEYFPDREIPFSALEVAQGFITVANEAMIRPIRNLTTMKGYDVTTHALSCFGGAGGQHCCAIAQSLSISKVYVHRFSGVLSAFGLSMADVVFEKQEPYSGDLDSDSESEKIIFGRLNAIEALASKQLEEEGFKREDMKFIRYINCRYNGTDTSIMTVCECKEESLNAYKKNFRKNYIREYGFELSNRTILVDDIRIRAIGKATPSGAMRSEKVDTAESNYVSSNELVDLCVDGRYEQCPLFVWSQLSPNDSVIGPAIIVQDVATIVVEKHCEAFITSDSNIEINISHLSRNKIGCQLDPIYLSVFSHRFMGIAEQMGRALQRTSISVNMKERLDFSCALFDSSGNLIANAPHLPVHLGAMSDAVRYQVRYWSREESGAGISEGDVLVSNHPQLAGGSHLPDITVITPVFGSMGGKKSIIFFLASRGHHADVGGIAPGSMPPMSKTLVEEGAAIVAFKLVEDGIFQEDGITNLLKAPGDIPGNFGTRNLSDNLSDLKAQVAANTQGVNLMKDLLSEYSTEVILAYMEHIQATSEQAVRSMLMKFSSRLPSKDGDSSVVTTADDYLDDGTLIRLSVKINRETGGAVFDFEGTGHEIYGNLNAPPAVTYSAIIYCLRCLLPDSDIPLNQGCIAPITVKIPPGSLLNPSADAAVVGGNVLTSQRVTDVILRAFHVCAASQGCMNNLTFGDESMGYYETIAGGAGAGPTWHGCSGVHTHMTK
jgi:5-oxoprolinase (ATP-hydrolysing)